MSALLELARDYLDRMSNPVFGESINEEYSLRFAKLLSSEGFEQSLRREIRDVDNVDTLTSHGWMWLIAWAKATDLQLSDDLLARLFDEWSNVFAKTEIVDLATLESEGALPSGVARLSQFPDPFLARIMQSTVRRPDVVDDDGSQLATDRAEDLLVALLQVERPITLNAASTLLHHEWPGHRRLNDFFWAIADSLDSETRGEWIKAVQPPPRERNSE